MKILDIQKAMMPLQRPEWSLEDDGNELVLRTKWAAIFLSARPNY